MRTFINNDAIVGDKEDDVSSSQVEHGCKDEINFDKDGIVGRINVIANN